MTRRIQIYEIPNEPSTCPIFGCVYNSGTGCCDEPQTNKGNSDSDCHDMSNKMLLEILEQ